MTIATPESRHGADTVHEDPTSSGGPRRIQGGLLDPKMLWTSLPGADRKSVV